MIRAVIFTAISILGFSSAVLGQKGYEIGAWGGASMYYGDLNQSLNIKDPGFALGIQARRNFNTRASIKASLGFSMIYGSDQGASNNFIRNRNLSFRTSIIDLTTTAEINFFDLVYGSRNNKHTPYLLAGFSIFRFNPQAELDGTWYNLQSLGTEGQPVGSEYSKFSGGWVLGGGYKWAISPTTSINIELTTRFLFTDYLDDVSTVYPDKEILENARGPEAVALSDRSLVDGLGAAGRQRGDTRSSDSYNFFSISINRYFGGLECPKISKPRY